MSEATPGAFRHGDECQRDFHDVRDLRRQLTAATEEAKRLRGALETLAKGDCEWWGSYENCAEAAANPNEDFEAPCSKCVAVAALAPAPHVPAPTGMVYEMKPGERCTRGKHDHVRGPLGHFWTAEREQGWRDGVFISMERCHYIEPAPQAQATGLDPGTAVIKTKCPSCKSEGECATVWSLGWAYPAFCLERIRRALTASSSREEGK